MALKDIRVTFFYADEQIFDLVKKWRTRLRLVKWADEFYKRFGFKIDEFPYPYNEKKYRKDFSFTKIKGIRPDFTEAVKMEKVKNAVLSDLDALQKRSDQLLKAPPADLAEFKRQVKELTDESDRLMKMLREVLAFHNQQREYETQFRVYLQVHMMDPRLGTKPRIPVIFCEFVNAFELFDANPTVGETLMNDGRIAHLTVWARAAFAGLDLYTGPLILIDVEKMTKSLEYVLAHELVHAAGNTTADNQGTKGNIMIYKDAQGKSPSDVNLEPSDKAKMEVAFFVR